MHLRVRSIKGESNSKLCVCVHERSFADAEETRDVKDVVEIGRGEKGRRIADERFMDHGL